MRLNKSDPFFLILSIQLILSKKLRVLDLANYMAYSVSMKSANIAEFKDHLGKYLAIVEKGENVQICRRNIPLAMVIPSKQKTTAVNKTQLGCGKGSVVINVDLTEPSFFPNDWNMLQGEL